MLRRIDAARNRWRLAAFSSMIATMGMTMRAPITFALLTAVAATAGCGQASDDAAANAAAANAAAAAREQREQTAAIAALPEGQRNAVLFRAIRDAGQACQQVTASAAETTTRGQQAWLATCDDKGQWLVIPGAGGVATVVDARAVAGRTGP